MDVELENEKSMDRIPEDTDMLRTSSLFSQLLDLFLCNQFQRAVNAHQALGDTGKGSRAGNSSLRCCSASWRGHTRYEKPAMGFRVVWAS